MKIVRQSWRTECGYVFSTVRRVGVGDQPKDSSCLLAVSAVESFSKVVEIFSRHCSITREGSSLGHESAHSNLMVSLRLNSNCAVSSSSAMSLGKLWNARLLRVIVASRQLQTQRRPRIQQSQRESCSFDPTVDKGSVLRAAWEARYPPSRVIAFVGALNNSTAGSLMVSTKTPDSHRMTMTAGCRKISLLVS